MKYGYPQKLSLHRDTKRLMLRRSMWRRRAVTAALELATWQTGMPGRELVENEVIKTINKLHQWFREPRASLVIKVVQRRAIEAYRQRS